MFLLFDLVEELMTPFCFCFISAPDCKADIINLVHVMESRGHEENASGDL